METSSKRFSTILAILLAVYLAWTGLILPSEANAASPTPKGILRVTLADTFPWYGDMWPSTATDLGEIILAFGDGTGEGACIESIDLSSPSSRYNLTTEPGVVEVNEDFEGKGCPRGEFKLTDKALARWRSGEPNDWCDAVQCQKDQCFPLCQYSNVGLIKVTPELVDRCESGDGYSNLCLLRKDVPFALDMTKSPPYSTDIWRFFADESPTHMGRTSTKPSSLLYLKNTGRFYGAFHHPAGTVERGYNAVSRDGKDWTFPYNATTKTFDDNKTWTVNPGGSNFTVLMFIQMGKGYEDYTRPDSFGMTVQQRLGDKGQYVYAFGIRHEYDAFTKAGSDASHMLAVENPPFFYPSSPQTMSDKSVERKTCDGHFLDPTPQEVHLARVKVDPKSFLSSDPIIDRSKWEYLAGIDEKGHPIWSNTESSFAVPTVKGKLTTVTQASAMYHFDAGKFIFLTGNYDEIRDSSCHATSHLGLFVADTPWGPWTRVDNGEISSRSIAHLLPVYESTPAPTFQVKVATAGGEFAGYPTLYHLHIYDVEFSLP